MLFYFDCCIILFMRFQLAYDCLFGLIFLICFYVCICAYIVSCFVLIGISVFPYLYYLCL